MILYKRRPTDDREPRESQVYDLLDSLGIPYERIDHDPADNMIICDAIAQSLGCLICKNLLLCNRQHTNFYLLMIPSNKVLHTKQLSPQLHTSRLSFAEGEYMIQYLNTHPGSLSIMSLLYDPGCKVQLVVDQDILQEEYLGCHPCVNTSSLKLKTQDVFTKYLPAVHHDMVIVHLVD